MKNRQTASPRLAAGFTLVELMVVLVTAAVLMSLAVPNLRDFSRNSRLAANINELLRSMQMARNEAIKRQLTGNQSVIVCASNNALSATPTCSYDDFSAWIVFADTNGNWNYDAGEPLIEQHNPLDSVSVGTDNSGIVSYNLSGFANPPGAAGFMPTRNIVICDERGAGALGGGTTLSLGRALIIEQTGRARATSDATEVTTALGAIGDTCP